MPFKKLKLNGKIVVCAVTIIVLLVSTIVFAVLYHAEIEKDTQRIQMEKYIAECYEKQNDAFCLGRHERFMPYTQLRNFSHECGLYQYLCYYNYKTDSDLKLKDIWEYLSMPYEYSYAPGELKDRLRLYIYYDEIKDYVDFMEALNEIDVMTRTSWMALLQHEYAQLFKETVDNNPALSGYKSYDAPFQLINEVVHKIVDPTYEMNLEITDERNYMYLTPEAYATGASFY